MRRRRGGRRRGGDLGGEAGRARRVQQRGRRLFGGHGRLRLALGLELLLGLLALAGLAGGGGLGGGGGGPLALLALGGDLGRERLLLLLALRLVFLAAVDPALARRELVDLERALELVRRVLVHRAGRRLGVHAQLLEAIDDFLAREVQIPRELEDPNVPHPPYPLATRPPRSASRVPPSPRKSLPVQPPLRLPPVRPRRARSPPPPPPPAPPRLSPPPGRP